MIPQKCARAQPRDCGSAPSHKLNRNGGFSDTPDLDVMTQAEACQRPAQDGFG